MVSSSERLKRRKSVIKENLVDSFFNDNRYTSNETFEDYYSLHLSEEEKLVLLKDYKNLNEEFSKEYDLNTEEKTICWIAGAIAGMTDAFLVGLPKQAKLSQVIDKRVKNMYSSEEIRNFEKTYKVSYDASTSKNLETYVKGLGPTTHRYQSLGHDPLLGFFYGVRDIMKGTITAFDTSGNIIVQSISGVDGQKLFEAIAMQIGHLKSDLCTASGLPVPFMPLLQKLQFGDIDGRTIGEMSRIMYRQGYNFNHLLSMSIPAIIIEVLVRLFYTLSCLKNGKNWRESIPFNNPILDKMLFQAYLISAGCNGVKMIVYGGNPLAFNLPIWIQTLRYGIKEIVKEFNNDKGKKRHEYIYSKYTKELKEVDSKLEELFKYYDLPEMGLLGN